MLRKVKIIYSNLTSQAHKFKFVQNKVIERPEVMLPLQRKSKKKDLHTNSKKKKRVHTNSKKEKVTITVSFVLYVALYQITPYLALKYE